MFYYCDIDDDWVVCCVARLRRPVGRLTVAEQKLEGEYRYVNSRLITNRLVLSVCVCVCLHVCEVGGRVLLHQLLPDYQQVGLVCLCVVCVYVCMRERERERERTTTNTV